MSSKYKITDQTLPYFVTYTAIGWIDIFTRSAYKNIILESLEHCCRHKGLNVHAWCIMTNHVHLIISTQDKPMETIMRDHKRHTSEAIHKTILAEGESRKEWMLPLMERAGEALKHNRGFQLWQQDYHPVALARKELLIQRMNYIHENPVRAGFVASAHHWVYSSAVAYAGGNSVLQSLQLIEI